MADLQGRLVGLTAVAWGGLGIVGLASPEFVVGAFDQRIATSAYRGEVRGVYGGMSLCFAGALAWANRDRAGRRMVLKTIGLATAGIAAGRVITAVADGQIEAWPTAALLASEVTMAAGLLTA